MTSSSAASAPGSASLLRLLELVSAGGVFVLTGAGVSTESGIPDYRDEQGAWKLRPPIQYKEFTHSAARRQRYWSRSVLGWARMRSARPNPAHQTLASLEAHGLLALLVTQNVDGLHQAAGARNVVDLHGRIDQVVCLDCGRRSPREALQQRLADLNPGSLTRAASIAPDGDADPGDADTRDFRVAACEHCGGVLKPDVVFFGEHVPAERVKRAFEALEGARSLLVVGSSLMVFSGYRFARAAAQKQLPIGIVNRGRTRADELSTVKIEASAGEFLPELERALRSV
ncbi:MAG TPA: NAD-dependent protein deacetylase [Polyangiaceae bacterium]|nr:NAD-dependent protein deacetylase [Polyangiaceae bacterium]